MKRDEILEDIKQSNITLCRLATVIILIAYITYVYNIFIFFSNQEPLINTNILSQMNQNASSYFSEDNFIRSSPFKVILVVFDGLREDFLINSQNYLNLTSQSDFKRDSLIYSVKSFYPTMSVPNWITLLTGAPPELTGAMNNLLIKETQFDNIFSAVKKANLVSGITASPWFKDIVDSSLLPLKSNGIIPNDRGNNYSYPNSQNADLLRLNVLFEAMESRDTYNFFLAHFSDIDTQGHQFGAKSSQYKKAIEEKFDFINAILNKIDNNTILFISSDHGQVNSGGHGGVSEELVKTPLIVYKKNSNLSSIKSNYTFNSVKEFSQVTLADISPTICALLGLPVPRQNLGRYLDDVISLIDDKESVRRHYYDLAAQKRNLITNVANYYNFQVKSEFKFDNFQNIENYIKSIGDVMETYYTFRENFLSSRTSIYVTINSIYSLACFFLLLIYIQKKTFLNLLNFFSKSLNPILSKSLIISFVITSIYNVLIFGVYFTVYNIYYGYTTWDSTVLHDFGMVPTYVVVCLVAPFIITFFINLIFEVKYLTTNEHSYMSRINYVLFSKKKYNINLDIVYAVRILCYIFSMFELFVIISLEGTFSLCVPSIVPIVTKFNWQLRFQLLTVQIMLLPLLISNLSELVKFSPSKTSEIYLISNQEIISNQSGDKELILESHILTSQDY